VDYQPKVSSKHACKHLRRHISHRTTRYQPTTLTWTASYDSRDRLTALVRSNTSSRYQYDANSNRLTSVAQTIADTNGNASFEPADTAANTALALSIESSSNRLLGFTQSLTSVRGTQTLSTVNSAVNYSLDAAGNLSSDGLRAFGYDATNRHTSTRSPAGADTATVQYLFNALGQRVFKSVVSLSSGTGVVSGGTNTATVTAAATPMPTLGQFYSYADDSEGSGNSSSGSSGSLPSYALLGEYCNGASGCVQQEYLWLPLDNGQAIPIGMLRSSRLYAIHTDHLGTPRLIHDDSNTPVWQWAYSAFGENAPTGALKATTNVNAVFALGANNAKLAVSAPGITVNLRFAGQYADSESNLFQNGFRSYAPAIGSYSQMDPIGLSGGLNRRGYVGGNAMRATDAYGLAACVLITKNSWGFGTHSALHLSQVRLDPKSKKNTPVIYDPSGSYADSITGEEFVSGSDAAISKFKKYHKDKDGDTTDVTCKNTTQEEEQRLYEKALEQDRHYGLTCAIGVSDVLSGSPYFPNVDPGTRFPGNLGRDAK
jgi:RHS repeat-associated protein